MGTPIHTSTYLNSHYLSCCSNNGQKTQISVEFPSATCSSQSHTVAAQGMFNLGGDSLSALMYASHRLQRCCSAVAKLPLRYKQTIFTTLMVR